MKGGAQHSPWAPLRQASFRHLWLVTAASAVCLTMHDVAAAWLMASMTTSPAMIALVQTAATAPVFILGLLAGAVADKVDKQRMLAAIQFWSALVASGCGVAMFAGAMTPNLLLAFTFCSGSAIALRYPVVAAEMPATVPRDQLPAAMGLNALAFNTSRIAAPMAAGMIISLVGTIYVFALNAVVSIVTGITILLGTKGTRSRPGSSEPLASAMRGGFQFVRHSPNLLVTLLRVVLLFLHTAAPVALLPLVAQAFPGAGATTYAVLFGSIGAGSVLAVVLVLPLVRVRVPVASVLTIGPLFIALATLTTALSNWLPLVAVAMMIHGMALTTTANSLAVMTQSQLPDWVRARGMAIHLCTLMGGTALGAALWGQFASHSTVQMALMGAAGSGIACALGARLLTRTETDPDALEPGSARVERPALPEDAMVGAEFLLTITYQVNAADFEEFLRIMDETRRSRLRRGAREWRLYRDIDHPDHYVEYIRVGSWTEHERSAERADHGHLALRAKRLALHRGTGDPLIARQVMQPVHGTNAGGAGDVS